MTWQDHGSGVEHFKVGFESILFVNAPVSCSWLGERFLLQAPGQVTCIFLLAVRIDEFLKSWELTTLGLPLTPYRPPAPGNKEMVRNEWMKQNGTKCQVWSSMSSPLLKKKKNLFWVLSSAQDNLQGTGFVIWCLFFLSASGDYCYNRWSSLSSPFPHLSLKFMAKEILVMSTD